MTVRIACLGVAAGVVSALIGGWDTAMETLCIAMLLDYASGLIVAGVFHKSPKSREGGLESKAALKGLLRKSLVVAAVIAFHQLDRLTGKSYFRDGAAWAFFSVEVISILENVGLIYPLPKFVTKAIDWLHNKSDALADVVPDADLDKGGDTK